MLPDTGMCIMTWLEEIPMVKKSPGGDSHVKKSGISVGQSDLNPINETSMGVDRTLDLHPK